MVRSKRRYFPLLLEPLEDRTLPSATLSGVANWVEQGPGPINGGQVEGISPLKLAFQNPVAGAVQAIAVDPSDANRVFVGTVNGGIWRTTNATVSNPNPDKVPPFEDLGGPP